MVPTKPPFLTPGTKEITQAWKDAYGFVVRDKGGKVVYFPQFGKPKPGSNLDGYTYVPTPKQLEFHTSTVTNCIIEGSRGTGKSGCIRMDAHMRALTYPNYSYLIIRRTMPELKKSHLKFMGHEMKCLGGGFHKTDNIAYYSNGSQGFFGQCENEDEMMKLLSSEYCVIYFDEISTFTWPMITKIASCVRVPEDSGLLGLVRGGTNPIGVGAAEVKKFFITKTVEPEEDPEYVASDWAAIHTTLADNPHIDREQYIKRLSNLPEHIRRAWLDGEWVVEGAYFHDYKPMKGDVPWHVVQTLPTISNRNQDVTSLDQPFDWIQIYRAIDWGFSPDPAVCLWIAALPNKRAFVFKERTWKSTPAWQVAKDITFDSAGMRVVDTYCDPSMFFGQEATDYQSIGDIFENNGVSLTPGVNDRAAAGYAIHEYLNTLCEDQLPQIQIYEFGCPKLTQTLGEMRTDKLHPEKIADGPDHWVIALSYFCMGRIGQSKEAHTTVVPKWMRPNPNLRRQGFHAGWLGRESSR